MDGTTVSKTNPPPLYDTLYPIIVDYLGEREMLAPDAPDYVIDTGLTILDHLLDGEDGLGYRIWEEAFHQGSLSGRGL